MATSNSVLKLALENCWYAITHLRMGTPRNRDMFQTGLGEHGINAAVRQVAIKEERTLERHEIETIANATADRLLSEPHYYRDREEPPIPPENVFEGRDLVLARYELLPPVTTGWVEIGLAMDRRGYAVQFGCDDAWYDGVLDYMDYEAPYTDEDGQRQPGRLIVEDDKTSWADRANWLDTLQCKGYTLLAHAHAIHCGWEVGVIERRVYNARTRYTYTDVIDVESEEGVALLDKWQRDIFALVEKASAEQHLANPGPACCGCPFVRHCEPAKQLIGYDWFDAVLKGGDYSEGLARQYAAVSAWLDAMTPFLRNLTKDKPVSVPGGRVGYEGVDRRIARQGACEELARAVPFEIDRTGVVSLLSNLKLGAGQFDAAAKWLHNRRTSPEDWKDERAAFLEAVLETVTVPEFGVRKDDED